jgi:hypothetical protein
METPGEPVMDAGLFAGPGMVHVDGSALAQGQAFRDAARVVDPGRDWIIGFAWADDRRHRRRGTNDWIVTGAGLDVCVYERAQVPPEVVLSVGSEDVVVMIRRDVLERSATRTIRTDPERPDRLIVA